MLGLSLRICEGHVVLRNAAADLSQSRYVTGTVRSPEVWRRRKAAAAKVGSTGMKLVVQIADAFAKQVAQESLDLEL